MNSPPFSVRRLRRTSVGIAVLGFAVAVLGACLAGGASAAVLDRVLGAAGAVVSGTAALATTAHEGNGR